MFKRRFFCNREGGGRLDINTSKQYDARMRTTLTLDEDVAEYLQKESLLRNKPFKQVVNEAVRRGMSPGAKRARPPKFRVVPHNGGFASGINRRKINQLNDELEAAEFVKKHAK